MADRTLERSHRALKTVTKRIADERRDERLNVAAGLHDEVLPPLYKVHLMGQVLRQDLASGRLLALEDDLPELLDATERASEAMRVVIRELRRSSLGPGGLTETLRLLVKHFEQECDARFSVELEDVGGAPLIQLLVYQVAREALYNAVRHSGASEIRVRLVREATDMRIVVSDNGRGFDPDAVDSAAHFGLQLVRERVELAGGLVRVESRPGGGTELIARLPAETSVGKT